MKKYISLMGIMLATVAFGAQSAYFEGNTDKNPLSYKCGETMKFSILLVEDGKPKEGVKLKWTISADDGQQSRMGEVVSSGTPLNLEAKICEPGFVRVVVEAIGDDGKVMKATKKNRKLAFEGGAGACIEKIKNTAQEPEDFDVFWQKQLTEQAKIPMNAKKTLIKKFSNDKYEVYELTIDCLGKPAKAFLSIPKGAEKKSLPMSVFVHGYGVGRIYPVIKADMICLSVARHSYKLLQDDKYYNNLKHGELKAFGFSANEHTNPEDCYFKFMIMRDLRALEYAKANVKEWNGKDISVSGGSMGGFQSVFIAALDKDVSLCRPHIPWMTDLWAHDLNPKRQVSTFRPVWTNGIRYFDATFAIKRIKCPIEISAWLGDYVCPPAGIAVLYNNAKAPISLDFGQDGTHGGSIHADTAKHYKIKKN